MTFSHAEWITNHRDAWLSTARAELAADHGYPAPAPVALRCSFHDAVVLEATCPSCAQGLPPMDAA